MYPSNVIDWFSLRFVICAHKQLSNKTHEYRLETHYREHRAMSIPSKILVLTLLWLTMSYAILSVVKILVVQLLLLFIAIAVTVHILALKTPPPTNQV